MLRPVPMPVSAVASVATHALVLWAMVALPDLHLPEPPIPVEVRAAPRRPPPPPAPPPAPAPAKPTRPAPRGKGPAIRKPAATKPAPPRAPLPPPPPSTADLRGLGPSDARLTVLLRTDRLRASPHRDGVQALLEALPDYHTLLAGTGLTPLDSFDALLVATANPREVTATFLAARHADDPKLRTALAARVIPEWDPRVIRYVSPTLSVLIRPDAPAPLRDGGIPPAPGDGGTEAEQQRWLADLARFDSIADAPGGPSLLVTVSDLGALVRLGAGLPTPSAVLLAATADAAPSVRARLAFPTDEEAQRFEAGWPAIVQRFRASASLLGLGSMLDGFAAKRDGAALEIFGRVPEPKARLALSFARALIPRPPEDPAPVPIGTDGGPMVPSDAGARRLPLRPAAESAVPR